MKEYLDELENALQVIMEEVFEKLFEKHEGIDFDIESFFKEIPIKISEIKNKKDTSFDEIFGGIPAKKP